MKQNNWKLIPMEQCHVAQVAALEEICFADPWNEAAVGSELSNPLSYWLVALEDDRVIGYVGSQTVLGEADIMNVAVAPAYRRCGLGRVLLDTLQAHLTAREVHSLTLEVRPSNTPAVGLYESLGYVQVGRRPNYYHKPKEDALILRKEWSL